MLSDCAAVLIVLLITILEEGESRKTKTLGQQNMVTSTLASYVQFNH